MSFNYLKSNWPICALKSIALSIVTASTLIACTTKVPVYDSEVCADLGPYGAHCQHQYINQTRDIAKKDWDKERIGMLCENSQGFTDMTTVIDQLCAIYKDSCVYNTRDENTKALIEKLNAAHGKK